MGLPARNTASGWISAAPPSPAARPDGCCSGGLMIGRPRPLCWHKPWQPWSLRISPRVALQTAGPPHGVSASRPAGRRRSSPRRRGEWHRSRWRDRARQPGGACWPQVGGRLFAPSVLREHVADWFELDGDVPYMMQVYPIPPSPTPTAPAVSRPSPQPTTAYPHGCVGAGRCAGAAPLGLQFVSPAAAI
jgi:hypothetical protein